MDWVSKCMFMEVEGARPRGRPRKNWLEVVKNDKEGLGLASAADALLGEGRLWGTNADSGLPGAPLGFFPG